MKQETIEEAAKRLAKGEGYDTILGVGHIWIEGFEKGAQWQQEKMYSEEEVYKLLLKHQSDYRSYVRNSYPLTWSFDIKDWFEKYKKK